MKFEDLLLKVSQAKQDRSPSLVMVAQLEEQ